MAPVKTFKSFLEEASINNNYIKLYHGSNSPNISSWDINVGVGSKESLASNFAHGVGFYFTPDLDVAKQYGKYVYSIVVEPKRFIDQQTKIPKPLLKKMLDSSSALKKKVLDNWGETFREGYVELIDVVFSQSPDLEILQAIENEAYSSYQEWIENCTKYLKNYDGFVVEDDDFYVIFNINLMRNVIKTDL